MGGEVGGKSKEDAGTKSIFEVVDELNGLGIAKGRNGKDGRRDGRGD